MRTICGRGAQRLRTDPLRFARDVIAAGRPVALATVCATWGSAPVPVGGSMAVAGLEEFQGSVSGGCIENEVIVRALEVLDDGRPQRLRFGVDDATAWGAGLPCGGEIEVFVEAFLAVRAGDAEVLAAMAAARESRVPLTVATDIESGARRLFQAGAGPLAGDQEPVAAPCRIARLEGRDVFAHMLMPAPRIVIVGAVHIAQVLSRLTRETGYDCVVVDPREAYASPQRFPDCDLVIGWPDAALAEIGLDAGTAVVALSHVPEIDDEALMAACGSDCFYIGALGSRRNHARRRMRLLARGLGAEAFARISGPAGLDIGARGPAEIALSVLGEAVLALRGAKWRIGQLDTENAAAGPTAVAAG